MSVSIRIRLNDDEMQIVRRFASEKRQTQTEIIRESVRRMVSTEIQLAAMAAMEQRISQRLEQLPIRMWQEVNRQIIKSQQGGVK